MINSEIRAMTRTCVASAMVATLFCGQANGQVISEVRAINSTATPTIETVFEGINVYRDEAPGHRLVNIPCEFVESPTEVIVSSNGERTNPDYQLEVTVGRLAVLYILLDDRHEHGQPLDWMLDMARTGLPLVFFDTGALVEVDADSTLESVGDSIDSTFSIWATLAPAGTYQFYSQDFGDESSHYVMMAHSLGPLGGTEVIACVPEPNSLCLLVVAAPFFRCLHTRRKAIHLAVDRS